MANWNEGYVTDVNYTAGFYRELSPAWLTAAATLLGFRSPPVNRPYAYAELGCGQGFGTNLLAAANPKGRFFGFDFNPAQIANARYLAEEGGSGNVEFHEASFQQLAASPDTAWPQFDFVTLHGIYSWISRDNQLAILEFIRRFLKPGGLVYISYNCSPGWASMVPLRNLMRLHAAKHPARSDVQGREALAYIQKLREGGAGFFNVHGDIAGRLERMGKLDSHYLAHEYLNQDWNISDFAGMAEDCATHAKLGYLGSASLAENLDNLSAPASLLPMLVAESDPLLRQTILDFATNKGFRRDIFQKGPSPLTLQEHLAALQRIRLVPVNIAQEGPVKFKTPLGEADGRQDLYEPLLKILSQTPGGMALGAIAERPEMAKVNLNNLVEAAVLLFNAGYAHPGLETAKVAQRFNLAVCQLALDGHNYNFLAAPLLGSAIPAGFTDLIAVRLLAENPKLGGDAFAEAAWHLLEQHRRRLLKNGVALESKEASAAELKAVHAEYQAGKGERWRRLGVLP